MPNTIRLHRVLRAAPEREEPNLPGVLKVTLTFEKVG